MWLLICCLLCAVYSTTIEDFIGGVNMLPAMLADVAGGTSVYTVNVMVGTPARDMRLVVDFNAAWLVLNEQPHYVPDAVMTRIGSHHMLMDYEVDSWAAGAAGCPECDGVFPMGSGSPIWFIFDTVTVTSGTVFFNEFFEPEEWIPCKEPMKEFCVVRGTILDEELDIYITPNNAETILPGRLYRKYKHDRELAITPAWNWDDLDIHIGNTTITIPSEVIYQRATWEDPRLMIDMRPDGRDYAVIGNSALRAMQIVRKWNTHSIGFREWHSERTYGTFSLFIMLLCVLAFFRWVETDPIYRIHRDYFRRNPVRVGIEIGLEVIVIFLPLILILAENTYHVLLSDIYLAVVMFIFVGYLFGWGVLTQLTLWGEAPERAYFMTRRTIGEPRLPAQFLDSRSISLPTDILVGIARQRQVREYVHEMSLLLSVFFIAMEVRQDTFGTFFGLVVYVGYLATVIYHTVASFVISKDYTSAAWLTFLFTSIVMNTVVLFALYLSVFTPAMRRLIPRDGPDLIIVNILTHILLGYLLTSFYYIRSSFIVGYVKQGVNYRR